jgi:hypothetical protein
MLGGFHNIAFSHSLLLDQDSSLIVSEFYRQRNRRVDLMRYGSVRLDRRRVLLFRVGAPPSKEA